MFILETLSIISIPLFASTLIDPTLVLNKISFYFPESYFLYLDASNILYISSGFVIISFLSFSYAIYLFIDIFFYGGMVEPGIASLLISQFLFFGIILTFLGIMGEYISAIHSQVRKKPLVIERETINF